MTQVCLCAVSGLLAVLELSAADVSLLSLSVHACVLKVCIYLCVCVDPWPVGQRALSGPRLSDECVCREGNQVPTAPTPLLHTDCVLVCVCVCVCVRVCVRAHTIGGEGDRKCEHYVHMSTF